MTELTKHLPLIAYEGSILSALGRGLTIADAHHDLSPAEGEEVMAEIVRRVNLHDELVEALRNEHSLRMGYKYTVEGSIKSTAEAILAKVDAAKGEG